MCLHYLFNQVGNSMKYLRNYLLRGPIFWVMWVWLALVYSANIGSSCCTPNDYREGVNEKLLTENLFFDCYDHPEDTHHCQCKHCDISNIKDSVLPKAHHNGLKEKRILAFKDGISDIPVTSLKELLHHTHNKYPPLSRPILLLKSSFLL